MSVHRGRRAEIGHVMRNLRVRAGICIQKFGSDAVWHLKQVQLSSHNLRNTMHDEEAAEQVRRWHDGRTVTFRSMYFGPAARSPYIMLAVVQRCLEVSQISLSSRIECGSMPEPASVQDTSSGSDRRIIDIKLHVYI